MNTIFMQDLFFLVLLMVLSVPLGIYIYNVMTGQKVFLSRILSPLEKGIYNLTGVRNGNETNAKRYAADVLIFSGTGFLFLFLIQLMQGVLPFNPQHMKAVRWDLAFSTAASFVTNTNWQAYSGESTLSYLTQSIGMTVQNFLSAGVGIAVLFALIRGFTAKNKTTIGCFWQDLVRAVLYILLPLSFLLAVLLVSQGVVQTFIPYKEITTLEEGIRQILPLGPAASQIAIKQLGTNGGGFFGLNSAFPLENPTAFSNLLELLSIMLIPASLCISFGKAVKNWRQGRTVLLVMMAVFLLSLAAVTFGELHGIPAMDGAAVTGNMEGKEVIHGIGTSALWGTATTAASNGSVNAMLDSFAPLGGMVLMFLMQLGEIIFGGVGSGLYGMISFVILTVFISGLMVGRTPEYLGKKIEPYDMKMVCLVILVPPLMTLTGTACAVMLPGVSNWLANTGAHGFSEILYAFTSLSNNNGSSFAGFTSDTLFTNIVGGIIMLAVRFIPMTAIILLAGNLSSKKIITGGEGTLSTTNLLFILFLLVIILIIGALGFLPALSLGPVADYFTTLN